MAAAIQYATVPLMFVLTILAIVCTVVLNKSRAIKEIHYSALISSTILVSLALVIGETLYSSKILFTLLVFFFSIGIILLIGLILSGVFAASNSEINHFTGRLIVINSTLLVLLAFLTLFSYAFISYTSPSIKSSYIASSFIYLLQHSSFLTALILLSVSAFICIYLIKK